MERLKGYYWVKFCGEFEIAKWTLFGWQLSGVSNYFIDQEMDFINENRIKEPGELPD